MKPALLNALFALLSASTTLCAEDPKVLINEIQRASNQSLLWGPYDPSLYFGMRPRIPQSLFMGLMWARVNDFAKMQESFRHTCEQGDNMAGYGWEEYDGRTGGKQVIRDKVNQLDIETYLVKVPGGEHGGSWGVRIKGIPRDDAPIDIKTTVFFYVGIQGFGEVELMNKPDPKGIEESVFLSGSADKLGDFQIEINEGPDTNSPPTQIHPVLDSEEETKRTWYHAWQVPTEHLWQIKHVLFNKLKLRFDHMLERFGKDAHPPPWQTFTLGNTYDRGNLHMVQKVFEGAFEFDVLYTSKSAPKPMTKAVLEDRLETLSSDFMNRFNQIYRRQAPFDVKKYEKFSHALFSNLLGGIGYFHGTSIVDRTEYTEDEEEFWLEAKENREKGIVQMEGPTTLFTSIPSRPFFPRGFYWDEGFHLIPVIEWDVDLTLEIVKSWFGLMDETGWIAREQILGDQARSKVPKEFQIQYPHYANPPTLFFILSKFLDKAWEASEKNSTYRAQGLTDAGMNLDGLPFAILSSKDASLHFLRELYPLLRRHYAWFRESQAGDIRTYDRQAFSKKEAYRWRGRAPGFCLTSGIDDYPRPEPPHPGELHVDLMSWVGIMTRQMKRIATVLDEFEDAKQYEKYENAILRNLEDLHWSEEDKMYCDSTVDKFEESIFVCHAGYISIFPLLVGLVPSDSPRLGHLLNIISDKEHLWSPYGLRSLSRSDPFYSTGENYWRGPIWVNMNYLAIERLKEYGSTPGPHQERAAKLYTELRKNLVTNVYNVWEETGFAWEQYEQESGHAKGVQHFLGWTSLVVTIMGWPETVGLAEPQVLLKDEL